MIICRWFLLRIRNVSDGNCRENQNTHFVFSNIFFFFKKLCRMWDSVEKYGRVGQTADENMAHATGMQDTWGYKYIHSICHTSCFFTATLVTRTLLIFTLIRTLPLLLMLIKSVQSYVPIHTSLSLDFFLSRIRAVKTTPQFLLCARYDRHGIFVRHFCFSFPS